MRGWVPLAREEDAGSAMGSKGEVPCSRSLSGPLALWRQDADVGSLGTKSAASLEHPGPVCALKQAQRGGGKGNPATGSSPVWCGLGLLEPRPPALTAPESSRSPLTTLQVGNLKAQAPECLAQGHTTGKWPPQSGPGSPGSSQGFLVHLLRPLPSQSEASA